MLNRQSKGLKFMERNIRDLLGEHFNRFHYEPFDEHDMRNAYIDFRTEVFTIRGFGYYIDEVIMYTNDINVCIRITMKNYLESKRHVLNFYIKRWYIINILRNYTSRILNFSSKDFETIISNRSERYSVKHKGVKLFVIEDSKNQKVIPLPCVSKIFTNNPNNKILKIANNNSKCYMVSKAFNIECKFNDCYTCYRQCLEHLNNKNLYLVKK